jgi:hypothetical protein
MAGWDLACKTGAARALLPAAPRFVIRKRVETNLISELLKSPPRFQTGLENGLTQ